MKIPRTPKAVVLAASLLLSGCLNLNAWPVDAGDAQVASARSDSGAPIGPEPAARDAPQSMGQEPSDAGVTPPMDPSCQPGFHTCAGACQDSKSVIHCGVACDPCPSITGGEATCDGIKCGVKCPDGQKVCGEGCIDVNAPCDGTCPAGKNPCNGTCVAAADRTACGTSCTACPTSANGKADCDGSQCSLTCNTGFHRCGDECKPSDKPESCGTSCSPCPKPQGGDATCGTNGACQATCPAGAKLCAGVCIGASAACNGQCPTGKHDCGGNCVADTDLSSCGTSCMPCPSPNNADATCDGKACGSRCRNGFHACNNECVSNSSTSSCGTSSCTRCAEPAGGTATCNGTTCDFRCDSGRKCHDQCIGDDQPCDNLCAAGHKICNGKCILTGQCCSNSDCGRCQECSGGTCRNQGTGQDAKNECGGKGCSGGACRSCVPGDGPTCMGGALKKCNSAGTGYSDTTDSCGGMGCSGNKCLVCKPNAKTCLPGGKLETCNGAGTAATTVNCPDGCQNNACVQAVAYGSKCTSGGTPCKNGGNCVDGYCCAAGTSSCPTCTICNSTGACSPDQFCKQPYECHGLSGKGVCLRTCDLVTNPDGTVKSTCPNNAACDGDNFCDPIICQPNQPIRCP
jgi:hypothetical protein